MSYQVWYSGSYSVEESTPTSTSSGDSSISVVELTSIRTSFSSDDVDVTNLSSTNEIRMFIKGLTDYGTIDVEGNMDYTSYGLLFESMIKTNSLYSCTVIIQPTYNENAIQLFYDKCHVNLLEATAPHDDKVEMSSVIKVSCMPTLITLSGKTLSRIKLQTTNDVLVTSETMTIEVLEYQGTESCVSGTTEDTVVFATTHSMQVDDFWVNETRRSTDLGNAERASRRVVTKTTTDITNPVPISGQTDGDVIRKYSFIDRTSYVKVDSLTLNLRAEGKSECSFDGLLTDTYLFNPGQMIRVYNSGTLKFTGIIASGNRRRESNVKTIQNISCMSLNNAPQRRTIQIDYDADTTSSIIVSDMIEYLVQEGITSGTIDDGIIFNEDWKNDCITIGEVLDQAAQKSGFQWFIDENFALQFYQDLTTISWCTYSIGTASFTDYRNITIEDSIDNYVNKVFTIGGEDAHGDKIIVANGSVSAQNNIQDIIAGSGVFGNINSDGQITEYNFITAGANTTETTVQLNSHGASVGDMLYNITQDASCWVKTVIGVDDLEIEPAISGQTETDEFEVWTYANIVGQNMLKKQCTIPQTIEFTTYKGNDFIPQTKITVSISDMSVSEALYCIDEVSMKVETPTKVRSTVKCIKRNPDSFSTQKKPNYVDYYKNF
jgi:hypothetical protein